jgi:acyl-coenzyme A synthetase/AMP-(fatty) acid ligase/aryl carrier-like protein
VAYLQRQPLDLLDFTPTLLEALLAAGLGEQPEVLPRCLLVGGEKLSPRLGQTLSALPGVNAYNVYGPTECTVDATAGLISPQDAHPSIGRPLANVYIYLLDTQLNPVPPGGIGEICIGGAGVGRGYLNQRRLTAERFVPNPYGPPGSRLYRSGDLARYRSDGTLDHLGRWDRQIKLRGFRIELGEIEARLKAHPQVQEAVVVLREIVPGDERLVAYGVGRKALPGEDALRSWLKRTLPEYMLPVAFVSLPGLPLTPNGKLDRKALPMPEFRAQSSPSYEASRTLQEQQLADIWAACLQQAQVGIHDNFFELGGDSIRSIQVASRANRAGLKMTPQMLFQYPTVAALAAAVEAEPVAGAGTRRRSRAEFAGKCP